MQSQGNTKMRMDLFVLLPSSILLSGRRKDEIEARSKHMQNHSINIIGLEWIREIYVKEWFDVVLSLPIFM